VRRCGGCEGGGAHWRWCPAVVGRTASLLGQQADAAEDLGDRVGANVPGAANHLYVAASLLREAARERTRPGVPRDGSKGPETQREAPVE
jgi:hypothetical protein